MSGGKDGQTLFHRIIPATTMGLTSKTAKNWHLEVKYIEHKVCLTKSYCSEHAKNQFQSSVTRLATPTSDHVHPKIFNFDQLLIYVNLYQHVKNQAISLICSGNMVD